jgi:hypothetical protein
MSCTADQSHRESILRILHHTERFTKNQVTHNIKGEPISPIRNISRYTPALFLHVIGSFDVFFQDICGIINIMQDMLLHAFDGIIRKCIRYESSLTCMRSLINCTMNADGVLVCGKRFIEI